MAPKAPRPNQNLIPDPYRHLLRLVSAQADGTSMRVYLAGGIVRDLLLGRPIKDLDLVVEGDAIRLARSLAKSHGGKVTVHPRFGTATWLLPADTLTVDMAITSLDLATARRETYPYPGALPVVEFAGIQDDLSRRDFAINAMALQPEDGHATNLLDPFGGRRDLEQHLVRVLHPRSFVDDPTRMFRALRYSDRYGFAIAPDTLSLFNAEALRTLGSLSGERLRHELDLIFEEAHPAHILRQAAELGLLAAIDPRLPGFDTTLEKLLHSAPGSGLGSGGDRKILGYLLWLADLAPEVLAELSRRLAFDGALDRALRSAAHLLRDLPKLREAKPSQWTERLDRVPQAAIEAVYLRTGEPALDHYLHTWQHIHPRANGEELKRRGLVPGPAFKTILARLRSAWLDGEVSNEQGEAALLERLLKDR